MSSIVTSIPPKLRARAQALLSRGDDLAMHLTRVLATPAGIDKFLMTIYYTMKLVYPQIARLRALRADQHIQAFISKAAASLLPGETLVAPIAALTPPDGTLATLEASSRALAALISDFRIFVRCWGLLGIYTWGRSTWTSPPEDKVLKRLVWGQVGVNTGFQLCENVAYLASKGVLRGPRFGTEMQNRWWMYSCRFWAAHTALEAARLLRVWQLSVREAQSEKNVEGLSSEEARAKKMEATQAWSRAWYVNAAYAPMTVHYSIPNGLLTDEWLGALGIIAGSIGLRHMWKQTV